MNTTEVELLMETLAADLGGWSMGESRSVPVPGVGDMVYVRPGETDRIWGGYALQESEMGWVDTVILFSSGSFRSSGRDDGNVNVTAPYVQLLDRVSVSVYSKASGVNVVPPAWSTATVSATPHAVRVEMALRAAALKLDLAATGRGELGELEFATRGFPAHATPQVSAEVYADEALVVIMGIGLLCAASFSFFPTMVGVVSETESGTRSGLTMLGVGAGVYWLSVVVVEFTPVIVGAVSASLASRAASVPLLSDTSGVVDVVVLALFTLAVSATALFVSAIVGRLRTAVIIGSVGTLVTIMLGGFLLVSPVAAMSVYHADVSATVPFLLETFVPIFPFTFVLSAIQIYTRDATSSSGMRADEVVGYFWGTGSAGAARTFGWAQLGERHYPEVTHAKDFPSLPTPGWMLWRLGFQIVMWVVAAWAVGGNGGGVGLWGAARACFAAARSGRAGRGGGEDVSSEYSYSADDDGVDGGGDGPLSVEREKELVRRLAWNDARYPVQLRGVSLSYEKPGPGVRACKFWRDYEYKRVIRNVHLAIPAGQVLTLLADNGGGKSTLSKALWGGLVPSHGHVVVGGVSTRRDPWKVRSLVGMCPQTDIVFPELTAREHVVLYARLRGVPSSRMSSVVDASLARVKLVPFASKRVGALSGGVRRRLSFALALLGDPLLVVLDEPSAAVDPIHARVLWDIVKELKRGGRHSFLLTTHNAEEANALSDKVAVVEGGKVVGVGGVEEVGRMGGSGSRVWFEGVGVDVEEVVEELRVIAPGLKVLEEGGTLGGGRVEMGWEGEVGVEREEMGGVVVFLAGREGVVGWGVEPVGV